MDFAERLVVVDVRLSQDSALPLESLLLPIARRRMHGELRYLARLRP